MIILNFLISVDKYSCTLFSIIIFLYAEWSIFCLKKLISQNQSAVGNVIPSEAEQMYFFYNDNEIVE